MCDFLSGFINIETGDLVSGDLRSHSESARLLGIETGGRQKWREFEWSQESADCLTVRTIGTDRMTSTEAESLILSKYPSRSELLKYLFPRLPAGLTTLYLSYAKLPQGITFPAGLTTLYLRSAKLPQGITFPAGLTTLDLSYAKLPQGITFPAGCRIIR